MVHSPEDRHDAALGADLHNWTSVFHVSYLKSPGGPRGEAGRSGPVVETAGRLSGNQAMTPTGDRTITTEPGITQASLDLLHPVASPRQAGLAGTTAVSFRNSILRREGVSEEDVTTLPARYEASWMPGLDHDIDRDESLRVGLCWLADAERSRPCLPVLRGPSAPSGRRHRGTDEQRRRSRRRPRRKRSSRAPVMGTHPFRVSRGFDRQPGPARLRSRVGLPTNRRQGMHAGEALELDVGGIGE